MNEALRSEGVNASGGVEHPPFHFDYLDVHDEITNAHAFRHANSSFIVVTLPMVELFWDFSHRLTRSVRAQELMNLDLEVLERDVIQGLPFQIQMNFLVAHEYTHHIHQHCPETRNHIGGVWTEFPPNATSGNIDSQAKSWMLMG